MELLPFDKVAYEALNHYCNKLENHLKSDVFLFYGGIHPNHRTFFTSEFEKLARKKRHKSLAVNLTTNGGSVEMAEIMVEVMRRFYDEVYFIVHEYAYSAGTILCMSGDKIYMNFASSLGPIDPQVLSNGQWVPAQGYLDQFDAICKKSLNNDPQNPISPVELQMALNLNLADLNFYQQARNLTVTLLKKWLVKYKFKDWTVHNKTKTEVTSKEKEDRAEQIAKILENNAHWHIHGRHIGIKTLQNELKLKIEDYSDNIELYNSIKEYNRLAIDFSSKYNYQLFLHTREMTNGSLL